MKNVEHPPRRTARRLAVISDFHLGRPGAPLACQVPTEDILAAVKELRSMADLIVVNGDLFDLERGTAPFLKRELRLLEAVHFRVVDALTGPEFAWVRGNHDRVLLELGRAFPALDVELPCGLFRIEHGDRFNAFIKRNESFTTAMTWLSGRLQIAPALQPIYKTMRAADHLLTGAATAKDEPIVAKSAEWLETEPGYRGMVIGHTHIPILHEGANGRRVMNPGGSTDIVHALIVEDEQAELFRWKDGAFESLLSRAI